MSSNPVYFKYIMFTTNLTLPEIVFGSPDAQNKIQAITKGQIKFPHAGKNGIILHGPVGTGKSTCAVLLPDAIEKSRVQTDKTYYRYEDVKSKNNGVELIDSIYENSKRWSTNESLLHYFVLDEVDNLTAEAMKN